MSNSVISRVRLFPLLILFAFTALVMRAVNIYSDFTLLEQAAQAAEQEADNAAQDTKTDGQAVAEQAGETMQPPVIGLPSTQEMELITQLRKRRQELEARELKLDLQEQLLASTEKRINDKIDQLKELEVRIKQHLRLFEEAEQKQLDAIVKVYETMKPKEAAPRFEALALQTQVDLVTKMKPSKVAALMENMTPQKASILTTELATQVQPPSIEQMQGGGN